MTEKIKTLKIIHLAVCAGVLLVYFMVGNISIEHLKKIPAINSSSVVYVLIPILAVVLGNFLFKSQLRQIDKKKSLEAQLPIYQSASIMRWAVLEGAAFLILFLKPDFVLFGLLIIIYIIVLRPTEERVKSDLQDL
ncbi:MFS transporter [Flavobacterium foetidum]|uniref:MFS transporter n=1 Tax=Flavobacterium foetidum TaxID=2026681 RepID=UPI001074EA2A|nr:MFS transporter [Flavobacterium foetidum]KAF2515135.1 MFS transporter [Flavobacterium foetidum]